MSLLDELETAVGVDHVLVDADLTASYETDWTGRFSGRARCVVRPRSTDQVAAVLRACSAHGAPVVVQGGNTGLVGGAVPAGGEVVVSMSRLSDVGEIDLAAAQVTVGAGVTLAATSGGWLLLRTASLRLAMLATVFTASLTGVTGRPTPAASGCCATARCVRS